MPIRYAVVILILAVVAFGVRAEAAERLHTKTLPHSIRYPLISPGPYKSSTNDPYQHTFGVRRYFKSVIASDYDNTLMESVSRHKVYSGYGVLGHGEDVFTNRADIYRRRHRKP